jgi:hypothetical protein
MELRDAFARYPGPILNPVIDKVRDEVKWPVTVADFTTRADALMILLERFDPRSEAERQREREEKEVANKAEEAAVRQREVEQREAEAERYAGVILARHSVASEQRDRVRPVALAWARAQPQYGDYKLHNPHACVVMALARHDPNRARDLTYAGLARRRGDDVEDPDWPPPPDGLPDEPFRLFHAIMKES